MKLIRRVLFILLLLVLATIVFQNQQSLGMPLRFSFLHWNISLVLGFWILFAFAAGVVLFALVDAWRGMMLRLELRRRDAEIARLKELVQQAPLHAAPSPGEAFPE
jgi:uncharacterized integral membrane protein